jgi:hypothetical protein
VNEAGGGERSQFSLTTWTRKAIHSSWNRWGFKRGGSVQSAGDREARVYRRTI